MWLKRLMTDYKAHKLNKAQNVIENKLSAKRARARNISKTQLRDSTLTLHMQVVRRAFSFVVGGGGSERINF